MVFNKSVIVINYSHIITDFIPLPKNAKVTITGGMLITDGGLNYRQSETIPMMIRHIANYSHNNMIYNVYWPLYEFGYRSDRNPYLC